eukprot:16036-Heterococcus_DN1.PRE.2
MSASAEGHSAPSEGMECMACMEEIDTDGYVEYRTEHGPWMPSLFCATCVDYLLTSQWQKYVDQLAKASCKAEQRRLLDKGPPINISDRNAMPCPDNAEVALLWYGRDSQEHSAKLAGSLTGTERQVWWDEKLAFRFEEDEQVPSTDATNASNTTTAAADTADTTAAVDAAADHDAA